MLNLNTALYLPYHYFISISLQPHRFSFQNFFRLTSTFYSCLSHIYQPLHYSVFYPLMRLSSFTHRYLSAILVLPTACPSFSSQQAAWIPKITSLYMTIIYFRQQNIIQHSIDEMCNFFFFGGCLTEDIFKAALLWEGRKKCPQLLQRSL